MSETADVVVVGAGVMGCSTALELSRRGHRVVVVDQNRQPGSGSTSASSAIVRFNYSTVDGVALAWESYHCWAEWQHHLGAALEGHHASYRRTGLVLLDAPVAPRSRFRTLFQQVGVPYEEWGPDELRAFVPGIDPSRFWPPRALDDPDFGAEPDGTLGGMFTPDAGFVVDPQLATQNLADAAREHGARFRLGAGVVSVGVVHDHVAGVALADGAGIAAPVVVNAAGPWSSRLNEIAGVAGDFTVKVRPLRVEVHRVPAPPEWEATDELTPIVLDPDLGTYIRGERGGGMLIGGAEPECDPLEWVDFPEDANVEATREVFELQVLRAARRFPSLRIPHRVTGIAGVYDVSEDWTPIYDRTGLDGFYVAMGTSGNQFKNAPMVGVLLADLVEGVEGGHDHDATPLRHRGTHTGVTIDLGSFSRKRPLNKESSGTVLG